MSALWRCAEAVFSGQVLPFHLPWSLSICWFHCGYCSFFPARRLSKRPRRCKKQKCSLKKGLESCFKFFSRVQISLRLNLFDLVAFYTYTYFRWRFNTSATPACWIMCSNTWRKKAVMRPWANRAQAILRRPRWTISSSSLRRKLDPLSRQGERDQAVRPSLAEYADDALGWREQFVDETVAL